MAYKFFADAFTIVADLNKDGDGYCIYDWFGGSDEHGGLSRAENAETADEAAKILSDSYLGPDADGVGVNWAVFAVGSDDPVSVSAGWRS